MMSVNIFAMGKLKEEYFRAACNEYKKRISAFANIRISEPEPAFLPQDPSKAQIEAALAAEAEKLRSMMKSGKKIALCVEGKPISSEELAKTLEKLGNEGISTVNFLVGSSFGLDEGLKRECDMRLSMSTMTFPHSLARVMLLEQIYRAFSILNNSKYHK